MKILHFDEIFITRATEMPFWRLLAHSVMKIPSNWQYVYFSDVHNCDLTLSLLFMWELYLSEQDWGYKMSVKSSPSHCSQTFYCRCTKKPEVSLLAIFYMATSEAHRRLILGGDSTKEIDSLAAERFESNFIKGILKWISVMAGASLVKVPSNECHWILLMISQHWFR